MINNKKYKKIVDIYNEFDFLQDTIQKSGILKIFSADDILSDSFLDIYTTDIYDIKNYTSFAYSFCNHISYYLDSSDSNKINNVILDISNKFPKKWLKIKLFDVINSNFILIKNDSAYQSNKFAFNKKVLLQMMDLYESLKLDVNIDSNSNYIQDSIIMAILFNKTISEFISVFIKDNLEDVFSLMNPQELEKINNFYINLYSSYQNLIKSDSRIDHQIGNAMSYDIEKNKAYFVHSLDLIYDNLSTDQIKEKYNNVLIYLENVYKFYKISIKQDVSILNENLTEDEKIELLNSFKSSASIKELIKDIYDKNNISKSKLEFIIDDCIINNPKIKDKKFPVKKTKVVTDQLKEMFITHMRETSNKLSEQEIQEMIKKYKEYFYNVYFLQNIFNLASVHENTRRGNASNIRKFLNNIFNMDNYLDEIQYFVKEYITEIQNPNLRIEHNFYPMKISPSSISYGTLNFVLGQWCHYGSQQKLGYGHDDSRKMNDILDQLFVKNLILNNDTNLNKSEIILFYIANSWCQKLTSENLNCYNKFTTFSNSSISSLRECISPLRLAIHYAYYATGMLLYNSDGLSFSNLEVYEKYGSIFPLLSSINYSDQYPKKKFFDAVNNLKNHLTSYNWGTEYIDNNTDKKIQMIAEKYVLLKYLEKAHEFLVTNNREDLYNDLFTMIQEKVELDDEIKDTIFCESSALATYENENRQNYGKYTIECHYEKAIDFDSFKIYWDFIELNSKTNLFNIIDNFEDIIFTPNLASLTYPYKSEVLGNGNSYWGSSSRSLPQKYSDNTITERIYNQFHNLNENQKTYIFDKFFKKYIDDDFEFTNTFGDVLLNIANNIYDLSENSRNYYYTNPKSVLRYSLYTNKDDLESSLKNSSIMDTLALSYQYLLEDFYDYDDEHHEMTCKFNSKMNEVVNNYNCLKSLIY